MQIKTRDSEQKHRPKKIKIKKNRKIRKKIKIPEKIILKKSGVEDKNPHTKINKKSNYKI